MMKGTRHIASFVLLGLLGGCGNNEKSDGYGNFEATEVVVASEAAGRLVRYDIDDGMRIEKGQVVAVVDTTQLDLERRQLREQHRALVAQQPSIESEAAVYRQQRRNVQRDVERYGRLVAEGAAPARQLESYRDQALVIDRQIRSVDSKRPSVESQAKAVEAQVARIDDQISRSVVRNPVAGVVLANYAEPGEVVSWGKPLYRIADTGTMYLRAYISGSQLSRIRTGERVVVLVDGSKAADTKRYGIVTWISSKAEFTPKIIQTREERVNLVYAVKVLVRNPDGLLKIGMPGELRFIRTGGS